MKPTNIAFVIAFTVAASGCVSQGKYDAAVAQTQTTRAQLSRVQSQLDSTATLLAETNTQLEASRAEIARLEAAIVEATRSSETSRAHSETRIQDLRKRLDELKASHAAMEARAALFRSLALRLKKQVDAGDLTIVVRDGRMVLRLPNDVLFDTGRTELKSPGKETLEAIAGVMASMPDRQFQIAGHTDNVPIHNALFASNWELSSGRALRVIHYLIDHGVKPANVSAAGYGEMDPVAPNINPDGRQQNRRTEITVQPNIDELVPVP